MSQRAGGTGTGGVGGGGGGGAAGGGNNNGGGGGLADASTSDTSDGSGATGSDVVSWITWFCSLKGNEFFCEVDEDYIQDDFNLSGLGAQVPYYDYALDLILDADAPGADRLTEEQHELVESAAEVLYGLIHARFVLTGRGLAAVLEKWRSGDYGACPRSACAGQPVLPLGPSDVPRAATVRVWCPRCEGVFVPRSRAHAALDGAYFGTTCPHLLLLTYPGARPPPPDPAARYTPRVFGFRLHASATARRPAGGAAGAGAAQAAAVTTVAGGPTINNSGGSRRSAAAAAPAASAASAPSSSSAAAAAAGASASTSAVAPAAAMATAPSGSQEMKDVERR